jgi:hypothetical protein
MNLPPINPQAFSGTGQPMPQQPMPQQPQPMPPQRQHPDQPAANYLLQKIADIKRRMTGETSALTNLNLGTYNG